MSRTRPGLTWIELLVMIAVVALLADEAAAAAGSVTAEALARIGRAPTTLAVAWLELAAGLLTPLAAADDPDPLGNRQPHGSLIPGVSCNGPAPTRQETRRTGPPPPQSSSSAPTARDSGL